MACSSASTCLHSLSLHSSPFRSTKRRTSASFLLGPSRFVSPKSPTLRKSRRDFVLPNNKNLRRYRPNSVPLVVVAAQSDFLRVIQTVWKVGKDGIEAGTNLVPDSIPRPIARIGVAVVALSVSFFVLKSVLSTAFFVLAPDSVRGP
ncbi:PREDICTED: uncharacterized protein LOC104589156 isoform X2 [Nelumbo nucifera]|uniref:Uncharacterized protein LOC104589156 isoform X2 n=1 Tax=Nelumbo nucifera TaxID=4432 RepID=A0A1U7YYJ3_NELNU|nr:PREDICTED: uncharacterized protein LOC104589156 isoform X2 [Nelumbo nucifera]